MTQSTEPPYTCSVCTVVWEEGHREMSPYPDCKSCDDYLHPPLPRCPACGGETSPSPVSGRACIAAFTVNHQQWVPGLEVPYVFAAVELVEQAELYLLTNIIGCPVDKVSIGMPVEVVFEQHGEIFLPLFKPIGATDAR